jgi:quercetin dioxygenase-like cupin family protein
MPGKQLVVLPLRFPPTGVKAPPHQHPGSVYVYVTKGAARLGVEGQEPRVVSAGQGFFEPVGAIHNIDENVGAEPATAIAFMIVPDGAPLASVVQGHAGH